MPPQEPGSPRSCSSEQEQLKKLENAYQQALERLPEDARIEKKRTIQETFTRALGDLRSRGMSLNEREQAILNLKLAHHFRRNDSGMVSGEWCQQGNGVRYH